MENTPIRKAEAVPAEAPFWEAFCDDPRTGAFVAAPPYCAHMAQRCVLAITYLAD